MKFLDKWMCCVIRMVEERTDRRKPIIITIAKQPEKKRRQINANIISLLNKTGNRMSV